MGGGPKNMFRLLNGMDGNRFDISVACPDEPPFFGRLKSVPGISMYCLPLRKLKFSNLLKLARIVKANQIELVHSHGKGAGIWSRLLKLIYPGLRVVHHFRGIHYRQYPVWLQKPYLLFEGMLGRLTDRIVNVSPSEAEEALGLGLCRGDRQVVIPNGVDVPSAPPLSAAEARARFGLPADKKIIMTISRYSYQKNIEMSFRIVRELSRQGRNVYFVVIGGPDDVSQAEVRREIDELGIASVVFLAGERDNAMEWLCAADVYLSTARWEGLPTAVLEAMSLGVPVVASDVVGNKSVVRNGVNGFLVSAEDPGLYADIITKIFDDTGIRERLSKNALADIAENYSLKSTISAHERLYLELLKDNKWI